MSEVWSAAVAEHDGRRGAGCVAGDVGERLLRAAVEREARLRRERARAALDRQRHVRVRVVSESRDERLELRDAGELLAAERADGLPSVGEAVADELAGALDRGVELRARLLALGELARALQLDRRPGERVGEHVVQLGCDPSALRDCRRLELLLARVLELGEQQLGRVLARARLLDEVRDQREQRAQQGRGEHGRRRAAGERLGESETRRSSLPRARLRAAAAVVRRPSTPRRRRRARSHPAAAARRAPLPAAPIAAITAACTASSVDEARPDREHERSREHDERERDAEALPCTAGAGWPLIAPIATAAITTRPSGRSDVALAAEPLIGARLRLRLARALGRVHGQTIERTPARRNGPEAVLARRTVSRRDEPAAADLDDGDPGADLDQRHQHERDRPGGRADLVRDAEAAYGRLEAVADRERERHPGADPDDEQAAGDPADARQRDAVPRRRGPGWRSRRGRRA